MNGAILLVSVAFLACLIILVLAQRYQIRAARNLTDRLLLESETRHREDLDAIVARMKESFHSLSLDALSVSTEEFLKLAREKLESERNVSAMELEGKKGLIDQQLQRMNAEMEGISRLVREFERDRVEKFGELTNQLKASGELSARLLKTTNLLQEALASTKVRGQWGERMAEDVLRMAGFMENVNYVKQKTIESSGSRPDFTFLLPHDYRLNMDVKFPLDNYMRYLDAPTPGEKERFRGDFLRDVRARIKEVTTREYISTEQNTLEYVLLFIPNEQIYAFLHEQDSSILDGALRNRVVFCSPITLFAVLAVIRQAVDNFTLEQTSNEILSLFGTFRKQWGDFTKKLELVGKRIGDAQREYDNLATRRRRMLERPLARIEEIRTQRNLPAAALEGMGEGESPDDIGRDEEEGSESV